MVEEFKKKKASSPVRIYNPDEDDAAVLPGLRELAYPDKDGLLAGYALFRETVESATKVVKDFKNPK